MSSALIVGQPNVGKSSFVINFAVYLGLVELKFLIKQPAGFISTRTYQIEQAYEELTSTEFHKTDKIQSIQLKLPVGKQDKEISLLDSCGLIDRIHPSTKIRRAMAQTLEEMMLSEITLHILDITRIDKKNQLAKIDQEIYNFLKNKAGYKILVNKIDLLDDKSLLEELYQSIDKRLVIPISALYQEGFNRVKLFLLENV